jgi:hypothetical protein
MHYVEIDELCHKLENESLHEDDVDKVLNILDLLKTVTIIRDVQFKQGSQEVICLGVESIDTNKKLNFLHKGYGETEDLALADLVKRLIDDGGVLFCLD